MGLNYPKANKSFMQKWLENVVAKSTKVVDWRLIGSIGQWREINSKDFNAQLSAIEAKNSTINMVIHSGGGSIYEGLQLYNRGKKSKAEINTDVEGLAASMGSVLAMVGKHRRMAKTARMMLHQGRDAVMGSGDQLIEAGKRVNQLNQTLAEIYSEAIQHKHPDRDAKWVMDNWLVEGKDKWFTAAEAEDAGLVHEVYDSGFKAPASASHEELVAFYDNSLTDTELTAELPESSNNQDTKSMKKEQLILMLAKHGITFTDAAVAEDGDEAFMAELTGKIKELKSDAAKAAQLQAKLEGDAEASFDKNLKAAVLDGRIGAKQEPHYRKLAEKLGFEEANAALEEIEPVADLHLERTNRKPAKPSGSGVSAERKDWSHKDWSEKDPEGLRAMMDSEPEAYEKLVDNI